MRVSAIYQFREFTAAGALMRSDASLKRPQEINDVLLLLSSQPIETFDDLICLAAITLVISDGFHQVGRSSIMEEEDALSDAPERSGSELVGAGTTLRDAVGEAFAHVVDEKVGVKIRRLIGKRSAWAGRGAARDLCAVVNEGVWQWTQPILAKVTRPFSLDGVASAGGASIRMKLAKASMSEMTAVFEAPGVAGVGVKLSVSSGVALKRQPDVSSRSCGNSWLVIPISTLYASPANMRRDLFCAFHPKRVMVPSFALRFTFPLR